VHLEQNVLPEVPIRHWICSLPWGLRALVGYDKQLCSGVLSAFIAELSRSLKWRAKQELGLASVAAASTGAVAAVQRVDSAVRLNVHYHVLALDGVYVRQDPADPGSPLVFHALPTPTRAEVAEVARRTVLRVEKLLRAHGRSLDPEHRDGEPLELQLEHPALAACYDAAALGIAVSGDRAGQPSLRLFSSDTTARSGAESADEPVADVCGFSLYAKQVVQGHDRPQLERLCRYLTGEVVPHSPHDECAHRPPPALGDQLELLGEREDRPPAAARKRWAWLLAHVYLADLDHCPRCQGPMRWAEVATTPAAVARLLAEHGLAPQPAPLVRVHVSGQQLRLPFDT